MSPILLTYAVLLTHQSQDTVVVIVPTSQICLQRLGAKRPGQAKTVSKTRCAEKQGATYKRWSEQAKDWHAVQTGQSDKVV